MILALLTNIVTVFCAEKDRIRDSSMTNSLRLANMADIFSPEFADACRTVLHFPESERCAMLICTTMESTSVMMYQRIVPAAVGYSLIGSTTIILWKKPEVWTNDLREEVDNRCTFEWFQWLAIQLKEMQNDSVRPAYESRGDWKLLNFGNEL